MQDSIYDINQQMAEGNDDLICREALRVLHAVKAPDVSEEAGGRKEYIFRRMNDKIEARGRSVAARKRRSFWKLTSSVAAIGLLLVGMGLSMYRLGYGSGIAVREEAMVEVRSPLGVQSNVELPDGSRVTLNAGSTLIYPSVFSSGRRVILRGEGYFDVAKDEKHPFTVHTEGMDVKVLGTRFSLKAYQQEEQTLLTLEEGYVEVTTNIGNMAENILLIPNQQLMLNNRTGELRRKNVNSDYYTKWRDGKLVFRNTPLKAIASELERRFNVRILFEDSVYQSDKYHVIFEHGENLEQILNLLSYRRDWGYRLNGHEVSIVNKR